jgi:hypothetical protein
MDWARILAFATGMVDQELLARIEYLAAENRILDHRLTDAFGIACLPISAEISMAEISNEETAIPNLIPETRVDQARFGPIIEAMEIEACLLHCLPEIPVNDLIERRVTKFHRHESVIARRRGAFELLQSFEPTIAEPELASCIQAQCSNQKSIGLHALQKQLESTCRSRAYTRTHTVIPEQVCRSNFLDRV